MTVVGRVLFQVGTDSTPLEAELRQKVGSAVRSAERSAGKVRVDLDAGPKTTASIGAFRKFDDALKGAIGTSAGGQVVMGQLAQRIGQVAGVGPLAATGLKSIGPAGLVAGAGLAAFAVEGKRAVAAASALEEQTNAAKVTFDAALPSVQRFAEGAAAAAGLSERAALQSANAFGNLFTNLGATDQVAADASTTLVQLSGDLASFKDLQGGSEAAAQKLISGLVGETESLRQLGIVINESDVKQKAYQLNLASVGEELSEAEKVQARYALIIEKTSQAQGDFARTSNSLANAQRTLAAATENIEASFGKALTPAVADVTSGLSEILLLANDLTESFGGLGNVIRAIPNVAAFRILGLAIHELREATGAEERQAKAMTRELELQESVAAELALTQEEAARSAKDLEGVQNLLAGSFRTATDAIKDQLDAQVGSIESDLKVQSSTRGTRDAVRDYERAQVALQTATFKGAEGAKNFARAQLDVRSATQDLVDTQDDLAEAIERVKELQKSPDKDIGLDRNKELARLQDNAADSALDLTDAQLGLKRAEDRAAGSKAKLAKLAGTAAATAEEEAQRLLDLHDAEIEVQESELALERAKRGVITATKDQDTATGELNEILTTSTFVTDALTERNDELAEAQSEVERLTIAETVAKVSLQDATEKLTPKVADLGQLERDLAAAGAAVYEAEINQAKSRVDLAEQTANLAGKTLTLNERNALFQQYLGEQATALAPGSPVRAGLEGYAATIKQIAETDISNLLDVEAARKFSDELARADRLLGGIGRVITSKDFELSGTVNFERIAVQADVTAGSVKASKMDVGTVSAGSLQQFQGPPPGQDIFGNPAQHGRAFSKGEFGLVGEAGPELVRFGADARVYSNPDSQAMLGGPTVSVGPISIVVEGNADASTVESLRSVVRDELGRSVGSVVDRVMAGPKA